MKKLVIILGGAGRLGSELSTLFSREYLVLSVDVKDCSNHCDKITFLKISPQKSHSEENYKKIVNAIKKLGTLSAVIFANRVPFSKDYQQLNFGSKDIFESEIYFATELIESLLNNNSFSKNSAIIFITSTNGRTVSHQPLFYHLAKASIDMMVIWLADRLKGLGVRVNGIRIGLVGDLGESGRPRAVLADKVILDKRITNANDIFKATSFLISGELSPHVTGQILVVDGGYELSDPLYLMNKIGFK